MTKEEKIEIKRLTGLKIELAGSQNKLAKALTGVSSALLSQIMNDNWEQISDQMWRNVAAQVGFKTNNWTMVKTRDYNRLTGILEDAKENSNVFAVIGNAGCGKSAISKSFKANNRGVYVLQCNEYWNRKLFMAKLLSEMGRDSAGYTVGEMMDEIEQCLIKEDRPLIIIDEADKLTDQVLYFFITIYNKLEDHCGIVLLATNHLKKRIEKGLRLNKKGYQEIYSRMGRKFIQLAGSGSQDIAQVCHANGVSDSKKIEEIVRESECDLRRVKRLIHSAIMKERRAQKGVAA
jgi:dephospho-CoA kinase